jgi:RNA polymerase sigma-70 factor, ECF subfamily
VSPRPATQTREDELSALLGRVARGDEHAFEAVCRHIAAPVFGTIRNVVRDLPQSEEVAQEVLAEVWRSASRFDRSRPGDSLGLTVEPADGGTHPSSKIVVLIAL